MKIDNRNEKEAASILVVDDSPITVLLLLKYLEQAGFKIFIAPSGQKALQQLERMLPDIILMDVMMPGIDGFETCRRLKQRELTQNIPVIFMTAFSDTVDKLKGFEVGGVDYITKPFQHEEILARVNAHLTIRQLQQQLQKQNASLEEHYEQLEALNTSKDMFFSIISHDLKSPFSSLFDLLQLTEENFETYSPQKMKEMLSLMRKSAQNFGRLLDNLLTWSRIQRSVIEYCPQEIDIRELVARSITFFTPRAEQKQITLKSLISEKTPVYADYNMIDTVIRNLISNSLKFTNTGGKIEISITLNERFTEVKVSDTGIGIEKENAANLFRLDKRYKRLGTAQEKGTGLGLILCHDLVKLNGGCIWVKSEVDKGSSFTFLLPKQPLESNSTIC